MSSNSSKKKQEEKHLKILRDFLALPTNKTCFDCNQRGPTYVNTTIGSFVCISCSGKLRGLTPPHRVKSVTMASFTPEEIEFLKNRGNEYCRLVWMGHYNMSELTAETKDDQRFKDHLVAKYERRRWYVDPSTVADRLPAARTNGTNGEASHTPVQDYVPAPTTHSPSSVARPVVAVAPTSSMPISKTSDLLADLDFFTPAISSSSSSAAFASPRKNPSVPQSISQPSFANFQNADFFFSDTSPQKTNLAAAVTPHIQSGTVSGMAAPTTVSPLKGAAMSGITTVPPEDRYSALKDLDALFTSQTTTTTTSAASEPTGHAPANWTPSWNSGPAPVAPPSHVEPKFSNSSIDTSNNRWTSVFTPPSNNPSNPFLAAAAAAAVPTQPGTQPVHYGKPALPWANFSSSPLSGASNNTAPGNVFQSPANTAGHFGFGFVGHSNPMGVATTLTTSQSLDLSPKTWGTSTGMNPFMDTAATASFTQGRSHNPFL